MIHQNKQHLDRKLIFRLHLLFAIFVLMLIVIGYDLLVRAIGFLLAISGILIGLGIGFLTSRMLQVRWHEQKNKVITTMDTGGAFVLAGYLLFVYFRDRFFGHWLQGAALTAFGFSLLGGIVLGRYLNLRLETERILKEKNYQ
ncbi:hypothetical protein HY495_03575 [Candidatus Woesearchaeota archaeon]|nr:hypothetical protein [Candidatus Woesearchaeota archaeon]